MKKISMIALALMICVCCLASCAQIEHEIGKVVSVSAVDAVAAGFEKEGVEFEYLSEQDIAEFVADWQELLGTEMTGEVTSGLMGRYENPQTGDWVEYGVFGFSASEDATSLEQYYLNQFATEIEEGKAIVVNGGYIVNLTRSSIVIEQDE